MKNDFLQKPILSLKIVPIAIGREIYIDGFKPLISICLKVAPQLDSDAILRRFFKKKEFFWYQTVNP